MSVQLFLGRREREDSHIIRTEVLVGSFEKNLKVPRSCFVEVI